MQIQKNEIEFNIEQYRFQFNDSKTWKSYLETFGFVVIKNYLPSQMCQAYVQKFWDIIEYLSQGKVDRKKPSTQKLSANYPPVLHGGMIQYIGHSQQQWQLRTRCRPIFQQLWDQKDLKSSFDGFCFMNGRRNYQSRQDDAFLHVDQSPTKNYLWSYQGIMTLTDSDERGGGFVCVPKSHKYHHDFFVQKQLSHLVDNWFVFPQEVKKQNMFKTCKKINTKVGDFILFDSRTFHCNTVPKDPVLRVCTYICMIPSENVPEKVKEKRKKTVLQKRTSNHHPGDGFKSFPQLPRYLDNPKKFLELVQKINNYELNQQDKELV